MRFTSHFLLVSSSAFACEKTDVLFNSAKWYRDQNKIVTVWGIAINRCFQKATPIIHVIFTNSAGKTVLSKDLRDFSINPHGEYAFLEGEGNLRDVQNMSIEVTGVK